MKNFKNFFLLLAIAGLLTSCLYQNSEEQFPKCDLTDISYATDIKPILISNCYGCHSSSNASGNGGARDLEAFASLQNLANSGKIVGAITHADGFFKMPKGGSMLNSCDIDKIKTWVDNGSPNN